MLITLFAFEITLIILTVFTTHMVEHKFASIQASLGMYCSKRIYKTKADIHFIESMIESYNNLCSDTDEEPDLPSAISLKLHKEYIGRFSYVSVMNIANKARHLMWGIFGAEILIAWINQVTQDGKAIIIIFASLLVTVMMCFYGIIKGLNEKQETLIDEVTHYIKNVYPMEVKKQKKIAEEKSNKEKILRTDTTNVTRLDDVRKQSEQQNEPFYIQEDEDLKQHGENVQKENIANQLGTNEESEELELSAKDIAQLLKNL